MAFSRFGSEAAGAGVALGAAGLVLVVLPVIGIVCVAAWAMNAILPEGRALI
jgi:hypothetical protein